VGGRVSATGDGLRVEGADAVTLYLAVATGFAGFDRPPAGADPAVAALRDLEAALAQPYELIRRAHIEDHRRLFRRVALDLGTTAAAHYPTDERIRQFQRQDDPQLVTLLFQYGRYL